jgi:DUF971 family protein
MRPASFQVLGNELVVLWDDGHESYYPLEALRRACPCASCAGEPDLFGRMAYGPTANYRPESFQLRNVIRVGNYALQPNWMDGHEFGLWTFDRLRGACPCEKCRSEFATTP